MENYCCEDNKKGSIGLCVWVSHFGKLVHQLPEGKGHIDHKKHDDVG